MARRGSVCFCALRDNKASLSSYRFYTISKPHRVVFHVENKEVGRK